ncbi:hypothetical protein [Streptomyces sp. WG5]|uniref:hypothetical protein n=1 Tax=Streptomyces sp. WG5 TaxID=3417648 RepID=UPI003CF673FA
MNAYFLAWLIGVDVAAVLAYREVQWPIHWVVKAQHRMRSLGITSERDALEMFRTQHLYG